MLERHALTIIRFRDVNETFRSETETRPRRLTLHPRRDRDETETRRPKNFPRRDRDNLK